MATNTCTSTTATISGTDPNFVLTRKINNPEGAILYIKYTIGTSVTLTLTFGLINPLLSSSDIYKEVSLSGTALSAYTMVISSAGNYRIPLSVLDSEKSLVITLTLGGGADAVVVANIVEA